MGMDKQTDGQTEGWTSRRTNKRENIYSIFRDKLSLSEESLDNYIKLQLDVNVNDIIYDKKDPTQPNWKINLEEP